MTIKGYHNKSNLFCAGVLALSGAFLFGAVVVRSKCNMILEKFVQLCTLSLLGDCCGRT